jgi:flagellar hook assembly protein FlgD
LLDIYPNPSGAVTDIKYAPSGTGQTRIDVYSPTGRSVRNLYAGTPGGGIISLRWDGLNQEGRQVAPGVYFIIAREGHRTWAKKVVIQK